MLLAGVAALIIAEEGALGFALVDSADVGYYLPRRAAKKGDLQFLAENLDLRVVNSSNFFHDY